MFDAPQPLLRPPHVPADNWSAIAVEERRLHAAIATNDKAAVIGALKSLVESVARVTKELAGEPTDVNAAFDSTVARAHELLRIQPGLDLTGDTNFSRVASQASKMAGALGSIRNEFGTGHGRARPPEVLDEMVELSLQGGLMWVRWALRRLGPFTMGRPGPLIEDLGNGTFTSGLLAQRLEAANLPALDTRHQRALGVAVGQRIARETFVVRWDGLLPAVESGSLTPWTVEYRWGVATGLLENVTGQWSLRASTLKDAVAVLEAVPDNAPWLAENVELILASTDSGPVSVDPEVAGDAYHSVLKQVVRRPWVESAWWQQLAEHVKPEG